MKTAGRENPNRRASVPCNRANGTEGQNRSRSIKWAAKQEKFQPMRGCFFLTSTFIELTGSWQKTSYLSSEQQLNLVKLLSPTNLQQGVCDEGNAYFCNSDSGLPLRFTELNDNGDLVRPLPRNRYLRAGNCFPVLARERHR